MYPEWGTSVLKGLSCMNQLIPDVADHSTKGFEIPFVASLANLSNLHGGNCLKIVLQVI